MKSVNNSDSSDEDFDAEENERQLREFCTPWRVAGSIFVFVAEKYPKSIKTMQNYFFNKNTVGMDTCNFLNDKSEYNECIHLSAAFDSSSAIYVTLLIETLCDPDTFTCISMVDYYILFVTSYGNPNGSPFTDTDFDEFDSIDCGNNKRLCTDCLLFFWTNQEIVDKFMYYTKKYTLQYAELAHAMFVNIMPDELSDVSDTKYDRCDVYRMVLLVEIWHKFIMHPQFVRYFLLHENNNQLYLIFTQFWYGLRSITWILPTFFEALQKAYKSPMNQFYVIDGIISRFTDMAGCLFAFMPKFESYHLIGHECLCSHLNPFHTQIAMINIVGDEDYALCILSLFWMAMLGRLKQLNIDFRCAMKYYPQDVPLMLPIQYDACGFEYVTIQNQFRQQLKSRMIHCQNHDCRRRLINKQRKLCKQCKFVYYCSRKCQKADWKQLHRFQCKMLTQIKYDLSST